MPPWDSGNIYNVNWCTSPVARTQGSSFMKLHTLLASVCQLQFNCKFSIENHLSTKMEYKLNHGKRHGVFFNELEWFWSWIIKKAFHSYMYNNDKQNFLPSINWQTGLKLKQHKYSAACGWEFPPGSTATTAHLHVLTIKTRKYVIQNFTSCFVEIVEMK